MPPKGPFSISTIGRGYLIPIPLDYSKIIKTPSATAHLTVNQRYVLQGEECDEFNMPKRVYVCKGILKDVGGICVDSAIMKQVSGNDSTIFSLTKVDCKYLGIDFEDKLQLFPLSLNWKLESECDEVAFDESNLATYRPSPIDGTIHQMHVILKNVLPSHSSPDKIITPNGTCISLNQFLSTLKFSFKFNIAVKRSFPIVAKACSIEKNGNIIDERGLHLMLFFSNQDVKGIEPSLFEGKCIDDIFNVTWVENISGKNKLKQANWLLSDVEIAKRMEMLDKMMKKT